MRRPQTIGGVMLLAMGLLATGAHAQDAQHARDAQDGAAGEDAEGSRRGPRTSDLSFVRLPGAEDCVGSRELAEAVEERLGRSVFVSAARADVTVEGRVTRVDDPPGWRADIVLSNAEGEMLGEREIVAGGDDCAALLDPLVLVVAVMIDPDAALGQLGQGGGGEREVSHDEPPPPPSTEPEVREVVRTERVEVPVPVPGEAPGWQVELDGGVGVALGALPGVAPLWVGSVYFEPPSFLGVELELGLMPWATQQAQDGAEASFGMAYAGLLVCPARWAPSALSMAGCAGVHLGATRVSGDGIEGSPEERVTAEVVARARVAWRLTSWLSLLARPTVVLPLRRRAWTWEHAAGDEELFEPWTVGLRVDVGVGIHL